MAQKYPFPVDPELTQIAMAYRNRAMIADLVLPRIPVGKREFTWTKFHKDERFTLPDTQVGRKSRVNEVEFGASEETSSVRDYGLEDPIPQDDIDNAGTRFNPVEQATEAMSDLIALGREKRVADLVMDPDNYAASNKKAVSVPWTTTATSTPIDDILEALDTPLIRPNVLTFGQAEWRALSRHPEVVKAVHGNSGDSGIARRQQLAELFEVEEILVGQGYLNTARKGQAASFARVWSGVLAFHRNPAANSRNGITFGFTAQYDDRVAGQWEDKNIGLRGGTRVRVGESVKELISASDLAFLLTGVLGS